MAEGFEFVAEKFEAHGPRAGGRENIHDAAAQGEFAFLRNLRLRLVALLFEKFYQVEGCEGSRRVSDGGRRRFLGSSGAKVFCSRAETEVT